MNIAAFVFVKQKWGKEVMKASAKTPISSLKARAFNQIQVMTVVK